MSFFFFFLKWRVYCLPQSQSVGNKVLKSFLCVVYLFVFALFLPCSQHLKFPGQELNLHHNSNPSHSSDDAGSLTARPLRNSLDFLCFTLFWDSLSCVLSTIFYTFYIWLSNHLIPFLQLASKRYVTSISLPLINSVFSK